MQKDKKTDNSALSLKDENSILTGIKAHDKDSFTKLCSIYNKKIQAIAYGFSTSAAERDDLIQEGRIALYYAANAYDFKSSSFSTFATVCIRNRMLNWLEKNVKRESVALPFSSVSESVLAKEAVESIGFEDRIILNALLDDIASYSDNKFSPLEKSVFSLFIKGYTIKEICEILSINKRACDNALFRKRSKLKAVRD